MDLLQMEGDINDNVGHFSVSGESRAETDNVSELMSESGSVAGSLLRPEKRGCGRSDVLSQGSSGYVSKRSRPESDHSSEKEAKRFPHSGLNPEPAHSWTQGPTLVMPELSSQSPKKYRLQFPHAGIFQCSLTGLGFQMEGEGEVLFSTVQWDEDLLASTDQTPAGPLFSIDCPQGSVCQLHLPHCEILTGEGIGSLSVAHISGDHLELLPPLRVTDTHVVVNVTDMSLWGLLRRYIPFITIWGQVLPFLESRRSVLNLIVVPANDLLSKVEERHKKSTYIYVSPPYCTLTRGTTYSLRCDEVERKYIQPEHAEIYFYWSYGPNYHPTFQVLLSAATEQVNLRLLEKEGEQVWAACIPLPERGDSSMGGRPTEHALSDSAEKQLRSARREFVKRVSSPVLYSLLDGLLEKRVINEDEIDSVMARPERADRARAIIDMVLRKGARSCSVMMDLLDELNVLDPY